MADEPGPPVDRDLQEAQDHLDVRRLAAEAIASEDPARLLAFFETVTSVSASPYPSARMLAQYVEQGMPDLVAKIVATIDEQVAHRQRLERQREAGSQNRQNLAQLGAFALGVVGTAGALVAGYFGVPPVICIVAVVMSVGGPNAATVVARLIDRADRGS